MERESLTAEGFEPSTRSLSETDSIQATRSLGETTSLMPRFEVEAREVEAPATLGERAAAFLFDYLFGMTFVLAYQVLLILMHVRETFPSLMVQSALLFFAAWVFNLFGLGGRNGPTVGKRIMGLAVLGTDGLPAGKIKLVMRGTLGYGVSALFLGLGFLSILWNPEGRSWHDRIFDTRVVKNQRT